MGPTPTGRRRLRPIAGLAVVVALRARSKVMDSMTDMPGYKEQQAKYGKQGKAK